MAGGKFVGAVDQQRIFVITEIQVTAVTRYDHRQPAGHPFRGRKVETLSPARKHERIGNVVEKVHFPLIELFRNNLDGRGILRGTCQLFYPAVDRIGRVVERLDDEKYRVVARESNAIGSYQLLDALAGEPGRDMQESKRQGMCYRPALCPSADQPRQQARVIDPVPDDGDWHAHAATPDHAATIL